MLILVKLALKRISFIIISLVITVFITGNYFIYKQVTKAHKREFKAYIRTNFAKTEVIEINPSELFSNNQRITWLDENKEILLGEIMYDIVSIKNNGTKVLLTVVNDSEEKALMNEYRDEFNGFYNQNSAKSKNNIMKDFFGFKYLPTHQCFFELACSEYKISAFFFAEIEDGFISIPFSPPDFV